MNPLSCLYASPFTPQAKIVRYMKNVAMVVMKRYFKRYIIRRRWHIAREPATKHRYDAVCRIQRMMRRGLARLKRQHLKHALRVTLERNTEAIAHIRRIRCEIQLRLLQESMDRPIGKSWTR